MSPQSWSDTSFRVFGKSVTIYGTGVALTRMGTFLLIPLYTHSLPVVDYGLLATLFITLQIIIMVMGLGTSKGLIRFAAEYESKDLLSQLIGATFLINIAGALVVTALCCGPLLPLFRRLLHSEHIFSYVFLTCLIAFFQALSIQVITFYRARNERLKFVITIFGTMVVLLATNFIFLRVLHGGVRGVLLAHTITYGGVGLVVCTLLISQNGLRFSRKETRKLFTFSYPLLFALSGSLVMDSSAVYFLGYFGNLEQVAIFSLGFKIAQIAAIAVILPFQQAYEPFVFGNLKNSEIRTAIPRMFTYLIAAYTFISFLLVFFLRPFLPLIAPPAYFCASQVVFLLLPGIAFTGVYYIGESLLSIGNKTNITGAVVGAFTILNLVLNYFLTPVWKMWGAVIVYDATIALNAGMLLILGMRTFPIQLEKMRLGVAFGVFLFFLLMVFELQASPAPFYYSIIPLIALVVSGLLVSSNFCDPQEKAVLWNYFQGIRLRLWSNG